MRIRVLLLAAVMSCGGNAVVDGGTGNDGGVDAGTVDAGHDAGVVDAGFVDSGFIDSGVVDSGFVDSGFVDSGFVDAGVVDAGEPDAGTIDAGPTDAGAPDAGAPDAGEPFDAGYIDAGPCAPWSGIGAPFTLRVMAANLSSGNFQSYDPGHGINIIQGLSPDVVMLQEMRYGPPNYTDMAGFIARLDAGYTYYSRGLTTGGGAIPNGVLSRFKIADAGDWDDTRATNREFSWALIDLPGPRDLWVVSVHLLTADPTTRNNEASALIGYLNANVPATDFLMVGGDFNTDNDQEPAFATFAPRVSNAWGVPVDSNGNSGTNVNRTKPYDNVLVSSCIGVNQIDAGLVFDTRVFTPLPPPVQFGDSTATGMQHMGVVKDFVIQP